MIITKVLIVMIVMSLIYHPEGEQVELLEDSKVFNNHHKWIHVAKLKMIVSDKFMFCVNKGWGFIKLPRSL